MKPCAVCGWPIWSWRHTNQYEQGNLEQNMVHKYERPSEEE